MSSLPETLVHFRTDLETGIGRVQAARQRKRRRRQRSVALTAAALLVAVGTASAFGTVRDLLFGSGGSAYGNPAWSPDGRRIAFTHHRWEDTGTASTEVLVMSVDGSRRRNLTREWGREVLPIWSPDWRKIAFVRDPCAAVRGACDRISAVYVMNADGSRLRRVARGVRVRRISSGQGVIPHHALPAWSPDGRQIALVSDRDGNFEVYVMRADGSGQRNVTRNAAFDVFGAWSPDGRQIAFVRSYRDGNGPSRRREIYVMKADGSGQRVLESGHAPVWSPDGGKIAFRSDRDGNGEVYVMNADGSSLRRLTRHPASDGGPVWSPDGRKIAFVRFRHGKSDVYLMNADGSGQRNLTRNTMPARRGRDGSPAWSPDGRRIAFVSERDGNAQIYVVNADGSGLRRLTRNTAS